MHAVVIDGGRLSWDERPDPRPGDHELLVGVRAAGVNGADLAQLAGHYPAPPGWPPDIPGLEMAGEVVEAGPRVTQFARGDRVMALVGGGGQASLATVDETQALPVPAGLGWPEAGGFFEVFATAFDALFAQAGLELGERALVTGAAGGVGSAAVQLAAAAGAEVVAAVRDRAVHEAVAALGAARVIEPAAVAASGPFDVVIELVGAASLPDALQALAVRGRVVLIGAGSGGRIDLDIQQLMGRRARLYASTLRARSSADKAVLVAALRAQALPLLAAGRLHVPVAATFGFADVAAAYAKYAQPGKFGKVVLVA
jgi:NADPH:quinone reductase